MGWDGRGWDGMSMRALLKVGVPVLCELEQSCTPTSLMLTFVPFRNHGAVVYSPILPWHGWSGLSIP